VSDEAAGCDPCARPEDEAKAPVNRPGLPAIAWRIGTQPVFLRRMLARLPTAAVPPGSSGTPRPLAALNARAADDPAIALLDAWACVADVLTFYQERIANEGFLRTATELQSALQLARAIGYELSPGVAAGTHLAFNVETAQGSPRSVDIPVGTRIQSVPGAGQTPQSFEVVAPMVARPEWNAMLPRSQQPQKLFIHDGGLLFIGLDDDWYQRESVVLEGVATGLRTGDQLLIRVDDQALLMKALAVNADPIAQTTTVTVAKGNSLMLPMPEDPAPATTGKLELGAQKLTADYVKTKIVGKIWDEVSLASLISIQRWNPDDVVALVAKVLADEPVGSGEVYAFRQHCGFFGANAPSWASLQPPPPPQGQTPPASPYPVDWDANGGTPIWENGNGKFNSGQPGHADVFLERVAPEVLPKSWVAIRAPITSQTSDDIEGVYTVTYVVEMVRTGFGTSARCTGLRLNDLAGHEVSMGPKDYRTRTSTAYFQSESLPLAPLPVDDPVARFSQPARAIQLDRMVLGLVPGREVIVRGNEISGDGSDAKVARAEVAELSDVIHQGGFTTLYFKERLQYRYVRSTVTINANVARATHGETVQAEVLGSGDATVANQRFVLKRPPLTYVSAPTASGAASTLAVSVAGIQWQEQPSLYGLQPDSASFTVRRDADGRAVVVFGDGVSGARLPSGAGNVSATYRTGIGLDGEVNAGSLTLLLTRPYGVKDVTNPLAADGAQSPEQLADARQNAPRTVLTLDRIVSLQDFEDFTRAFAGIGKAQAVPLWSGQKRLVYVTIASASGDTVDEQSDLFQNVVAAIAAASDGTQELRVGSFDPRLFRVEAALIVDPDRDKPAVEAAVQAALSGAFSFANRAFGQRVTEAEIVSIVQGVAGIRACLVTKLAYVSAGGGQGASAVDGILDAQLARLDKNGVTILPGELLLLAADGVSLQLRDVQ
jgi:hypothetical protein